MNFFGHALVASWHSPAPAFALGAMLPDLATMLRARARSTHPDVAAGIDNHHATDRAFHTLPAFRTLEANAITLLAAAGLGRGPSRGAAHVAVELCLDATLVDQPNATAHYLAALSVAPSIPITWDSPDAASDFRSLVARLLSRGVPPPDPLLLADRVTHALSSRPLLALDQPSSLALRHALPTILLSTRAATPTILTTLRSSL